MKSWTFASENLIFSDAPAVVDSIIYGSICFMFWSGIIVLFQPYVHFHIFIEVRVTD